MERGPTDEDGERPIRIKIAADGTILFTGLASEVTEFNPGRANAPVQPGWTPSGFAVERFAGVIVGVA